MSPIFFKSICIWAFISCVGIKVGFAQEESKNPLVINVGIYAPFSNDQAFIGRNILGAMELARDRLSDNRAQYFFYTLDVLPPGEPGVTSTLQKFIETHHLNVLVTEGDPNGLMAAPLAKTNNMIHLSMASDPRIADKANNVLARSFEFSSEIGTGSTSKQKNIEQVSAVATDVFTLLNKSILASSKDEQGLSVASIAQNIHSLSIAMG
jgi:branched-chain amino acid transport system substrate-binding protein